MTDFFLDEDPSERKRKARFRNRISNLLLILFMVCVWSIVICVIYNANNISLTGNRNQPPAFEQSTKSQVAIYTDPLTGCQYFSHTMTPRFGVDNKQICEKLE